MIETEFVGLRTPGAPETRDEVMLRVTLNGESYGWSIYMQPGSDIGAAIEAAKPTIEDQLNQIITAGGVVAPPVPDYYALRRAEYPPLGDQLDAFWKGPDSPEYSAMMEKIQAVKAKYPKDYIQITPPVTLDINSLLPGS